MKKCQGGRQKGLAGRMRALTESSRKAVVQDGTLPLGQLGNHRVVAGCLPPSVSQARPRPSPPPPPPPPPPSAAQSVTVPLPVTQKHEAINLKHLGSRKEAMAAVVKSKYMVDPDNAFNLIK